jgi:signal transduction histidine kinase
MTLPSRSITVRLVFWLFLWTTVVMVSVGGILYHGIGKMLMSSVDRTLHSKLQIITGLLHEENGKIVLELSEIIAGEYVIPRSGHYYKVMAGNDVLAASPSLANDDFDFSAAPGAVSANRLGESTFTGTGPAGEPVRVLRYQHAAFGKSFTITLGESLADSYRGVAAYKGFLQLVVSLSIILLCSIAWWIISRTLRPLKAFSATIERITDKNLSERIDAKATAKELATLAGAFNSLLDRLHLVLESQKRLVADASHELKTPLSVIRTQCDVISLRQRSPEEYVEAIQTISSYACKMTRLINDLLSLARLDSGFISTQVLTPVSLRECIDEALGTLRPLAREKEVRVSSSVDGTFFVMATKASLVEAFKNLLENGVRYNRDGGAVTVSALTEGKQVVLTISDTGMGMAAPDLEKIFQRFYRAHAVQGVEGTGLGLSIVKAVIEALGGEITVQSEPGSGSRFSITLPLAHPGQTNVPAES